MDDRVLERPVRGTFRATITGIGRPGPIEERLGWRRMRVLDPESKEGATLLRTGQVTLIGPHGPLGRVDLAEARRMLMVRLESLLDGVQGDEGEEAIRDGLVRLRAMRRISRGRSSKPS